MKPLILVVLAFVACGPPLDQPLFVSNCGMQYMGSFPAGGPAQFDKTKLDKAEFIVMDSFYRDDLLGMNYEEMCHAVDGFALYTATVPYWVVRNGQTVMGETICQYAAVEIDPSEFGLNSYAHELAHVLQRCDPPAVIDEGLEKTHSDWYRDGIYAAIDHAQERLQQEFP